MVHPTCHEQGGREQQCTALYHLGQSTLLYTYVSFVEREESSLLPVEQRLASIVHHGTQFCAEQVFDMQTLRLRGILEWRDEVTSGPDHSGSSTSSEVMILIWPAGEFKRLPRGTTASEIVHDQVR